MERRPDGGGMIPDRRPTQSQIVEAPGFSFTVRVGFDPKTGAPIEVFIDSRGKAGSPLDHALYKVGVTLSRMMQGDDRPVEDEPSSNALTDEALGLVPQG